MLRKIKFALEKDVLVSDTCPDLLKLNQQYNIYNIRQICLHENKDA